MTIEELLVQLNRMHIMYGGSRIYVEGVDEWGSKVRLPITGEPWIERDAMGNKIVVMR